MLTAPRVRTRTMLRYAHARVRHSPHLRGPRSNSPAGWLVRPYGGTWRRAGGWWETESTGSARILLGDEAMGGERGGDVDGGRKRGLTGPALPSSLTGGLSSSREAVRLSFLDSQYPVYTEPLST